MPSSESLCSTTWILFDSLSSQRFEEGGVPGGAGRGRLQSRCGEFLVELPLPLL
jgi:hypothetical protein